MKYPFYSGLSGKTAIIFLIAFLAVMLPVNLIVYNKVKVTVVRAHTQQMQTEVEKLAAQTRLDPVIVPLPAPGNSIAVIHFQNGQMNSVFESPDFPKLETEWLLSETFEVDTLTVFVRKIPQPNDSELWFLLASSNQPLQVQLAEIKLYLFYVTGIVVVVIALLVFALSGIMFRPLKKLVASASNVQASEKMNRLPVPTIKDEVQVLAMGLNEMIGRIETSISQQVKFFDSATHELKTPLSILRAEMSKAQNAIHDNETREWLSSLLQDVERLERTIADFLLVSQLKNQTLTIRKSQASLPEILFQVLKSLRKLAEERGIKISVNQAEGSERLITIDADKIQTVLFNMLENAIRYSPEKSVVSIAIDESKHSIVAIVSNNSLSPPRNVQTLGLERYSESHHGMGLGLWICHQLTLLHGGGLHIQATDQNFVVRLELPFLPA